MLRCRLKLGEFPVVRGWRVGGIQNFLGEGLGPLKLGRGGRGAEAGHPGPFHLIDQARDQRRLRAGYYQLHVFGNGERHQARILVRLQRHVAHTGLAGGSGVAGRDKDFAYALGLRQFPGQRVLAAAAAGNEDSHQWRKWRTPVNSMATPRSSAAEMTSLSRMEPPG